MDYANTGALISQLRREKEMTQKQFAAELNISPTTVSKWERGTGFPDISLVEPLCAALGISIGELFCGKRTEIDTDTAKEALSSAVRESTSQLSRIKARMKTAATAAAVLSLVLPVLLVIAALLGAFNKPTVRGTYQSMVGLDENIVCLTVSIQDFDEEKTFVMYLNNCEVDRGTWRSDGGALYTLLGEYTRNVIALERDNSFCLTFVQINGGEPIQMEKKGDIPAYFAQDTEENKAYYRALTVDEYNRVG